MKNIQHRCIVGKVYPLQLLNRRRSIETNPLRVAAAKPRCQAWLASNGPKASQVWRLATTLRSSRVGPVKPSEAAVEVSSAASVSSDKSSLAPVLPISESLSAIASWRSSGGKFGCGSDSCRSPLMLTSSPIRLSFQCCPLRAERRPSDTTLRSRS